MNQIVNYWSHTGPDRLNAYAVEIARKTTLSESMLDNLRALALIPTGFNAVPWFDLLSYFNIYKNQSVDGPFVQVASLCMPEASPVNFGPEPFTIAHAWLHAGVCARLCVIKGLDPLEYQSRPESPVLGYAVTTAGMMALYQGRDLTPTEWDLAILDPNYVSQGQVLSVQQARDSAAWLRRQTHAIIEQAAVNPSGFPGGCWGLDGPRTT